MNFFLGLIVSAIAIMFAGWLLPGVHVDGLWTALVVAVVMAFLNSIVRPVLVLLTLPITVLTLGLFLLVINVLMVYVASNLIDGFRVDGFITALLFSLIVSVATSLLQSVVGGKDKD